VQKKIIQEKLEKLKENTPTKRSNVLNGEYWLWLPAG
jgi:hypothetical protein|tara:strand:- start:1024 stop:1134 length:111 start_codon:yes stop_codon:yes gene_type:complete